MQSAADEHWTEMAQVKLGRGSEAPEVGDFGWLSPFPQILEDCQMVLLTDYHLFPQAGGWHDQTEAFRADFKTYMRGYARKLQDLTPTDAPVMTHTQYEVPDFSSLG